MQNGSFKPRLFNLLIFSGVALFSLATISSLRLQAQKPEPPATAPATQAGGPEFKLRLQSNLVVVRLVVRDSQGRKIAALSKVAEVPSRTAAPAAKQVVPSGQGLASGAQGGETVASNKGLAVPSRISPPAAQRVAAADKPYFQAYRRAAPITKWSLKKLRHRIPELKGLKPATDQSQLPEVLRGVSANLQKFVVNFIDTTAVENIDEAETPPYWGGLEPFPTGRSTKHIKQKFNYVILRHPEGGAFNLVEYRTDLHGRKEHRQKQSRDFIKTAGFAAMPLFFGLLQQHWSEFRYLGRQTIGGVNMEVVAFAEHAEPVAVMGHFVLGGLSIPLLVQGVAWIRPGDYQIVQMRTDLLASLTPLTRMTAVVHFAGFQFQDRPKALWLPKEVEVKVDFDGYVFSNRHRYSNYQMFRVTVIQKDAPADQQH